MRIPKSVISAVRESEKESIKNAVSVKDAQPIKDDALSLLVKKIDKKRVKKNIAEELAVKDSGVPDDALSRLVLQMDKKGE